MKSQKGTRRWSPEAVAIVITIEPQEVHRRQQDKDQQSMAAIMMSSRRLSSSASRAAQGLSMIGLQ
jgi:hypothetical protein